MADNSFILDDDLLEDFEEETEYVMVLANALKKETEKGEKVTLVYQVVDDERNPKSLVGESAFQNYTLPKGRPYLRSTLRTLGIQDADLSKYFGNVYILATVDTQYSSIRKFRLLNEDEPESVSEYMDESPF